MNVWKIIGGAAVGVAAVVALPVAGPIGAVTGVGALIAGGGGAAAGTLTSYFEKIGKKQKNDNEKEAIANEVRAEYTLHYAKVLKKMEKMEQYALMGKFYLDTIAVALSAAHADGVYNDSERTYIDEMVTSVNKAGFEKDIKEQMISLMENPPSLNAAWERVQIYSLEQVEVLEETILMVIHIDGEHSKEEEAYFQAWTDYKNQKFDLV